MATVAGAVAWPTVAASAATDRLRRALRQRIDEVRVDELAEKIGADTGSDAADAAERIVTYLNESLRALDLVGPHLQRECRLIEVGSGIGFFSRFLFDEGYDVVELEPVGAGFEFIGAARRVLQTESAGPRHLSIGVEELDPRRHGTFDVIFSLNVLEHVPDWRRALDTELTVLRPGGVILQSCPNYTFPYEPHFGIPLVPFVPSATSRLLPSRIASSPLWASLNWITSRQVGTWARANDAVVEFRKGQLADALERITTDPDFGRRHAGLVARAATLLTRSKLTSLIRRMPVALGSPMEFAVRHDS